MARIHSQIVEKILKEHPLPDLPLVGSWQRQQNIQRQKILTNGVTIAHTMTARGILNCHATFSTTLREAMQNPQFPYPHSNIKETALTNSQGKYMLVAPRQSMDGFLEFFQQRIDRSSIDQYFQWHQTNKPYIVPRRNAPDDISMLSIDPFASYATVISKSTNYTKPSSNTSAWTKPP